MGLPYAVHNHTYPVGEAYRALNPLGTVPFLEDDGGVAINESVAIMLYVAHRYGPTPLLPPASGADGARCLQLAVFGETELGMNVNPLIGAHFAAPEADKRNWSVRGLDQRVRRAVDHADNLLRGRDFLVGDALTLADISVSCALGMWQGALNGEIPAGLAAYQQRLRARPAYQKARSRCVDGAPGFNPPV
jgi:glutathione S-transferase